MPLIEVVCKNKKCKHLMEKLVFGDKEEEALRCEKCKGKVKKIMSVPGRPEIHGFSDSNGYSRKPE